MGGSHGIPRESVLTPTRLGIKKGRMKNGSRYRARVLAALLLIVVAAPPANAAIEAGGSSTHLEPAGSLIPPLTRTTVRNQASVAGGKKVSRSRQGATGATTGGCWTDKS